ncbi:MAG: PTS sugar transporter subunit IIA [Spirochaetes bacterium]|jgi:PTS system nitrogen regulatory IIA component|nr:PTS sugar transporter subunit IIA [Spirochaetota bacterium]
MDLKLKDIANLLDVPETTIREWIEKKKIPYYKVKNQYYFNKAEINEWILRNKIKVSDKILDLKLTTKPVVITQLIERGGIHYNIKGKIVKDVLKNAVESIPVPQDMSHEKIISYLLEREEMMTTAVGRGIALPHSRNPIISDMESESISICLLDKPVNFNALDGKPVHCLFIIISSNSKRHLEILSKISFLCQQDDLLKVLEDKAKKEVILYYIEKFEKEWATR